jgi:Ice-binding-like
MSHRVTAALGALALALALLLVAVGFAANAIAATAPGLGAAASYAVLGGQTVTNTGPTTINGDLGVSPGTAVTNFPPGIVTGGTIHSADANALDAQGAVTTAYNALAAQPCTADLTGQDLGGLTLTEGVYCFSSSAQLTGLLTLNAQGSASAVFVFKTVSTLTTARNSSVLVTNGGVDCNVFWQVGSSATIGTGTVFVGNILALTSISLTTGASVSGRVLARNGSVTLDTNHVGFEACAVATATPTAAPTPIPTATPSPTPVGQTPSPTPSPTPVGQTPSPTPVGQTPTPAPTPTPVGQTPSPTPVAQTPSPTPSPTPVGQTPSPTPVGQTPSPTPVVQTSTPSATLPPPPAPTNTPSPTPGVHFPNTGGPPPQGGLPWMPVLGLALSGLGAAAFVLSRRGQRLSTAKAAR